MKGDVMATYNLTENQKHLLRTIVANLKDEKLKEPIIPVCCFDGCSIIGIDEDFGSNLPGDLDALSDLDLMGFRYNSRSDKIYTVKQAGYDAVTNDFVLPETPSTAQINIGAIVHGMSGGNLQAIGFADHAEVQQIANDPQLLKEQVDALTSQLLDSVKSDLPADSLVTYIKTIEALKEQIALDNPSPSIIQRLFKSLAFMGDLEGTISLVARVWPFLYPLLVIAAERMLGAG
jgi:hypothetical protein